MKRVKLQESKNRMKFGNKIINRECDVTLRACERGKQNYHRLEEGREGRKGFYF